MRARGYGRRGGLAAGVIAPSGYATTFGATENPISEGGVWINGGATGLDWNNIQTSGGNALATRIETSAPPYDDPIACLDSTKFSIGANQYAQATIFKNAGYTGSHECELLLRFAITAHSATGYEVYWSNNGGLVLVRWNGAINDFTALTSTNPGAPTDGAVLRVEISGSTITAKINGATQFTWTDSTWATGMPGIGQNPYTPGGDVTQQGWKDFTAGSL